MLGRVGGLYVGLRRHPGRSESRDSGHFKPDCWLSPFNIFVTPGLGPGVRAEQPNAPRRRMDCRIKSGNDERTVQP
jgi:hypothetical protein